MTSTMKSTTLRNCNNVFDTVIKRFELKNDAALARQLGVAPPVISKCRKGTLKHIRRDKSESHIAGLVEYKVEPR